MNGPGGASWGKIIKGAAIATAAVAAAIVVGSYMGIPEMQGVINTAASTVGGAVHTIGGWISSTATTIAEAIGGTAATHSAAELTAGVAADGVTKVAEGGIGHAIAEGAGKVANYAINGTPTNAATAITGTVAAKINAWTGKELTKQAAIALGGAALTGGAVVAAASAIGGQIDAAQERSGFTRG